LKYIYVENGLDSPVWGHEERSADISYGPLRQVAFLCRDIDASMRFYTDHLGVGPWFVMERVTLTDSTYRGAPCDIVLSAALAAWGPIQIELLQQHDDKPSIYRDWYQRAFTREVQHHVAYWVEDLAGTIARARDDGFQVEQEGWVPRGGFVYLTHPNNPDQVLELTERSAARDAFNAAIANAAVCWTGEAPRRRFEDAG